MYYYDLSAATYLTAATGGAVTAHPVLVYGARPTWELMLLNAGSLPTIASWRAAVARDFRASTSPMCRTLSGITVDTTGDAPVWSIPLDTLTERFLAVVDGRQAVECWLDLVGMDADSIVVWRAQLPVVCCAQVDPAGVGELTPATLTTKAQTFAAAAAASATAAQTAQTAAETALEAAKTAASAAAESAATAQEARDEAKAVAQIMLGPCTDLGTVYGTDHVSITWTDPSDVTESGATLARWKQTILVRKVGDWPADRTDGTVVATTSRAAATKNAYRDTAFADTGLTEGVVYYYKLFSETMAESWNNDAGNEFKPASDWTPQMFKAFLRANNLSQIPEIGFLTDVTHGEYTLRMRYVGLNCTQPADETLANTMTFESEYVLFSAMYDAPEALYALTEDAAAVSGHTYALLVNGTYTDLVQDTDYVLGATSITKDGVTYPISDWYQKNDKQRSQIGNNNMEKSNAFQWCNSEGPASGWFAKQSIWDTCSTLLAGKAGFLRHLDADWKDAICPVRLTTALPNIDGGGSRTIPAKVFFPSLYEIFGTVNSEVQEGKKLFDYYVGTGASEKIKLLNATATPYWLRSPIVGNSYIVCFVTTSGDAADYSASNARGFAPAWSIG